LRERGLVDHLGDGDDLAAARMGGEAHASRLSAARVRDSVRPAGTIAHRRWRPASLSDRTAAAATVRGMTDQRLDVLAHAWERIVADVADRQPAPGPALLLGTAVVALVLVLWGPAWRRARHVVTIAHEGGHAV